VVKDTFWIRNCHFFRSLGRRPSEDKVSLYLRKPSSTTSVGESGRSVVSPPKEPSSSSVTLRNNSKNNTKSQGFMEDMARRSLEVPTSFLDSVSSPKLEENNNHHEHGKKYPFLRTTTPNSLREQLKETLAKNLGSSTDLAETIQSIKDDEILDTFNIDSENIETPPVQRRAFRHRSFRLGGGEEDQESDIGSDFASRRRNHKFRTLAGDGRPLGDRELVIKKKRESTTDLSTSGVGATETGKEEEEEGPGLFDRFSSARKTLTRGSQRRKKESGGEEEGDGDGGITLELESGSERKQNGGSASANSKDGSNWRAKLASRFKKNSTDSYDLVEAAAAASVSPGQELRQYLSLAGSSSAPATEPPRRKPLLSSLQDHSNSSDVANNKVGRNSALAKGTTSSGSTNGLTTSNSTARKPSYILPGDYDSELVDGRYVTSVPIISVEEDNLPATTSGNLRPGHLTLRDLKSADASAATNRKSSLMERLARTASVREPPANNRPVSSRTSTSNVFDRLANSSSRSASRTSLVSNSGSGMAATRHSATLSSEARTASNSSLRSASTQEKPRGTLNKIKDITKSLRKSKEENGTSDNTNTIVRARNSQTAFTSGSLPERKPMSSINGGSHPSISSSTRSLNRSAFGSGKEAVRRSNPTIVGSGGTSSTNFTRSGGSSSLKASNSTTSLVKAPVGSGTLLRNGKGTVGGTPISSTAVKGRTAQSAITTSSKENLSRSSSSASRSSITNSVSNMSQAGSLRTAVSAAVAMPLNGSSSSLASARLAANRSAPSGNPLIRSTATNSSRQTTGPSNGAGLSFMKPTAASAKKVLVTPTNSDASVSRKAGGRAVTTTSSRVVPISAKPSRR
jgi:trimeric autotransporter adhesin